MKLTNSQLLLLFQEEIHQNNKRTKSTFTIAWSLSFDNPITYRMLLRHQLRHVVVVKGGFFAIHEFLYENDRFDWLVDHDETTCPVCEYYQMKHMMNKVKA